MPGFCAAYANRSSPVRRELPDHPKVVRKKRSQPRTVHWRRQHHQLLHNNNHNSNSYLCCGALLPAAIIEKNNVHEDVADYRVSEKKKKTMGRKMGFNIANTKALPPTKHLFFLQLLLFDASEAEANLSTDSYQLSDDRTDR